jgi:hypothetical protein
MRSLQSCDHDSGLPVSHEREGLSDAVMIPRMIKVLSEAFDPAWRLLLFIESGNFHLYAPARRVGLNCRVWQEINHAPAWTSKAP